LKMRLPCGLRRGAGTWARWNRFVGRIDDVRRLSRVVCLLCNYNRVRV
jgi:hypothetical protein